MLDIHMFSSATKVKGQGVGSAYLELIRLLEEHHADSMKVSINKFGKADISHYHTIDPLFFIFRRCGQDMAQESDMCIFCPKRLRAV